MVRQDDKDPNYLTAAEAATFLGVYKPKVYASIDSGKLHAVKIDGRVLVLRASVEAYAEASRKREALRAELAQRRAEEEQQRMYELRAAEEARRAYAAQHLAAQAEAREEPDPVVNESKTADAREPEPPTFLRVATQQQVQGPSRREVVIKRLVFGQLLIVVRGISPLIMNAFSERQKQRIREKQGGEATVRGIRDPEKEFRDSRYVVDGIDCMPKACFKKALLTAATAFRIKQAAMSLYVRGSIGNGEFIEIESPEPPRMREDNVKIGKFPNRVGDLRYRAEYVNWRARFMVKYDRSVLTEEHILNMCNKAGFSGGVGDWRPQQGKGGEFGRFELDMETMQMPGADSVFTQEAR